jgi:dihydroorotase
VRSTLRNTATNPGEHHDLAQGERLTLTKPDDWHLHVRDGELLRVVVPDSARRFARAIIMPNLQPPITTTDLARQYRERILAAVPGGISFQPLMTLFLNDKTTPSEIVRAKASGFVHGVKWYPAGATTNAEHGVREITHSYAALEAMQEQGLPLLLHAETTDPDIDIFDREEVFLDRQLTPVIRRFPGLRVVVEHLTTRNAVQFVRDTSSQVGGTITAHHLLLNRNALFTGGLRPHHYCRPVLKREQHRLALIEAATSGHPRFFHGTDSAPHLRRDKESACGCAGIYTAHAAIELFAEVFEQADALDRLEQFASFHGADFYGLPRNTERISLVKNPWQVATSLEVNDDSVIPFRAGESVAWRLADVESK